jgi:ribosomal protein S12 methylthiotransferase accessory factor
MRTGLARHGSPVFAVVDGETVWLRSRHGMLRLARSEPVLAALGEPDGWARAPAPLRRALARSGIGPASPRVPDQGCDHPLSVPGALDEVARTAAGGRFAGLAATDLARLETRAEGSVPPGRPCLVYLHAGPAVLAGVLAAPVPCPRCVTTRLRATYPFGQARNAPLRDLFDPPAAHADRAHAGCAAAGRRLVVLVRWLAEHPGTLVDATFGPRRTRVRPRPLLPVPACPGCRGRTGPAGAGTPAAANRRDRPGLAGVLRRYLGPVDARTGIVAGVTVNARQGLYEARTWTRTDTRAFSPVRAEAGGAAVKPGRDEAVVAALGEAFERYAAGVVPVPALVRARLADVADRAIDPRALVAPRLPRGRADAAGEFDPAREIRWVDAAPLAGGPPRLVPAVAVYLPYPAEPAERFHVPTSIGLAAGTSGADAAARALWELVERDAWRDAWTRRQVRGPVRLDRCCPRTAALLDAVTADGSRPWAADITAADGLPAVVAGAIRDAGSPRPVLALGLRAAASLHDAVVGALAEVVQSQLHVADLLRTSEVPPDPSAVRTADDQYTFYCEPTRLARLAFLWPPGGAPAACDRPGPRSGPEPGPGSVCRSVAAAGRQALVVDLTSVDLRAAGVHVVRVLLAAARGGGRSGPPPARPAVPDGSDRYPPPGWPPPGG